jgi:hypothetical protein
MSNISMSIRRALSVLLLAPLSAAAQDATPAMPPTAVFGQCRGDVQRLCAGLHPGGGRIIGCLRDHAADVSPGCQDALQKALAVRQAAPAPK